MEFIKKIILIIAINILFLAMSYYLYNYMVIEYDNYVLNNKIYLTILGSDEASVILGGGDIDDILNDITFAKGELFGS